MMGKNFWEDVDIDAMHFQTQINIQAVELITEYGFGMTETDILRMKAAIDSQSDPVKRALLIACFDYYMTTDYAPKRTDPQMYGPADFRKKRWWQVWKR